MHEAKSSTVLVTRIGQVIVAIAMTMLAVQAQAQLTDRAGKWEGTLQLRYADSTDIHGSTGSKP